MHTNVFRYHCRPGPFENRNKAGSSSPSTFSQLLAEPGKVGLLEVPVEVRQHAHQIGHLKQQPEKVFTNTTTLYCISGISRNLTPSPEAFMRGLGLFLLPQMDLEVLLHGFSDMCDIMGGGDQVVFGIEDRLHRQTSDPESWGTE